MTVDLLALSARVGVVLIEHGGTVSAAESCTGGLILSNLTDCSGSSAYVEGGVVTYSNEAKMSMLKVKEETLIRYGAVSEAVAGQMACGARSLFGTDFVEYLERHRHRGSRRGHSGETRRLDLYRIGGSGWAAKGGAACLGWRSDRE